MEEDIDRRRSRERLEEIVGLKYLEELLEASGHRRTRRALMEGCKTGRIVAKQVDGRGTWVTTKSQAYREVERIKREDARKGT